MARLKGRLLVDIRHLDRDEAEACLMRSLELSRRQAARAWELRAAIDLAGLRADRGRADSGRALLRAVVEQFPEGSETVDLQVA